MEKIKYSAKITDNTALKYYIVEMKKIKMIMYYTDKNKKEVFDLFLDTTLDYIEINKIG